MIPYQVPGIVLNTRCGVNMAFAPPTLHFHRSLKNAHKYLYIIPNVMWVYEQNTGAQRREYFIRIM